MARSETSKSAIAVMKAVSGLTFNSTLFGEIIARDHPAVQNRVMEAFLGFVAAMAAKITTDDVKGDAGHTIILSQRILDALDVYDTVD